MKIENDQILQDFIKDRKIKESTIKTYMAHFQTYSEVTGLTPTELIEEAEDEQDQNIKPRKRKIKKHLNDFQDYMIQKPLAPSRIKIAMGIIKHLYKHYDIIVPTNNVYKPETEIKHDIDLLPTLDDIRYALQFVPSLKYQAIIKLMMSSGMGRAEVLSLKICDFVRSVSEYIDESVVNAPVGEMCTKLIKNDEVVPEWKVVRVKIGYPYTTFSNTESVHSICEYLLQNPPQSSDDYLFRNIEGKQLSKQALTRYFTRINKKAGFETRDRLGFFRSHNIRKFFATQLIRHRMNKLDIDRLMGHSVKDQDDAYFKIDPALLKQEYMKFMEHVSLERVEYKSLETREYRELIEKNQTLIQELNQLKTEKDGEMATMEKKQEVLERMVKELMEKQLN